MEYNRKKYIYPRRYEIEQTLGEIAKRSFVDEFAQERGIFITKARQNELANTLSGFFFEHEDIEQIRDTAYKTTNSHNLSGFIINSEDDDFDPILALKKLREEGQLEQGMEISPITLRKDNDDEYSIGKISYKKRRPGIIEFLQEEDRSFEFRIQKISDHEHLILVDGNRSGESKVFEKIVKKQARHNTRFDVMDQSQLNSLQTIRFFDELAETGMSDNWELIEVKQLVFRRGNQEDEMLASSNELAGISQAFLEGKNLRENHFVKQSENNGYRFTAMTYKFLDKTSPHNIVIKAEFKFRPKVFEVNVLEYNEVFGPEENEESCMIDQELEMKIKTNFWRSAKKIFSDIQRLA